MLPEKSLIFDDRFSKFRQFFFFDAVFVESLLGQDDVEQDRYEGCDDDR